MNSICKGNNINLYTNQVIIDDDNITNITAAPMLTADFVSLETPRNGHSPKNLKRIKLLMKIFPIIIAMI